MHLLLPLPSPTPHFVDSSNHWHVPCSELACKRGRLSLVRPRPRGLAIGLATTIQNKQSLQLKPNEFISGWFLEVCACQRLANALQLLSTFCACLPACRPLPINTSLSCCPTAPLHASCVSPAAAAVLPCNRELYSAVRCTASLGYSGGRESRASKLYRKS
jgi:hypothetical protein